MRSTAPSAQAHILSHSAVLHVFALGSEQSCGSAERRAAPASPECRLPLSRQVWLAYAANACNPPFLPEQRRLNQNVEPSRLRLDLDTCYDVLERRLTAVIMRQLKWVGSQSAMTANRCAGKPRNETGPNRRKGLISPTFYLFHGHPQSSNGLHHAIVALWLHRLLNSIRVENWVPCLYCHQETTLLRKQNEH